MTGIDVAPHIPMALFWVLAAAAVLFTAGAAVLGARGWWARGLLFALLLLVLADPLIVHETRTPLPDVVAIVLDHSQSMDIEGRGRAADRALAAIKKKLAGEKDLEVRTATVATTATGEDNGTLLFQGLSRALADVPPDRVAGAILLTDGEVHDAPDPSNLAIHAPVQALIVGKPGERDRKLTIVDASRFTIVGHEADIVLRVDDYGGANTGTAEVDLNVDGKPIGARTVPLGRNATVAVPIAHPGENVVEIAARPGPAELTLQNNRAVVTVSGVRDRLRVLLVSGEPHAGERVWRDLLKADPSVDLVHFTILRPPEKQDQTPLDELSLIAFPVRELFQEKLDTFDLIIFDRYRERGILPLAYFENIAGYVDDGGALLVSAGPEFAEPASIYRTPLSAVLPAQPTGRILAQGFKPMVTEQGFAHPVTHDLPGANTPDGKGPSWGRWFRLIGANAVSGETVMKGPDNQPLLVLDKVGKGRVAELLSDQAWLWARGFEGGGPDAELLRRLAHWLMKEPELEEERLTATITNGRMTVERHTMAATTPPATVTDPAGRKTVLPLTRIEPGIFRAAMAVTRLGLYRLKDGDLTAVAAAGPLNPKEVADMRATDAILKPVAEKTGGSVHWLTDGLPDIRRVGPGAHAAGRDWIGLRRNGAYRVASVDQAPLLPGWLALVLLAGALLLVWRVEGR